jgi:hypothetical protein
MAGLTDYVFKTDNSTFEICLFVPCDPEKYYLLLPRCCFSKTSMLVVSMFAVYKGVLESLFSGNTKIIF